MLSENDVYDLINNSLRNISELDDSDQNFDHYVNNIVATLPSDGIEQLVKIIYSKNRSDKDIMRFICGYIYSHGLYINNDEIEFHLIRKSIIKNYLHSFNLESIKGEIYYKYDKREGKIIMLRWHNPKAREFDSFTSELSDSYSVFFQSDNEKDKFIELLEFLEKYKPVKIKDKFSKEEIEDSVQKAYNDMMTKPQVEQKEAEIIPKSDINIDDEIFS